jgi:hypothetical protein
MLKRELCLACHLEENYQEPKTTITLLAPANNAVVDRLPVPLIGTVSDARLAEVTAEFNDSRLVLSVVNSTFSTMLSLREGINTIRITGSGVVPVVLNILHNPALPKEMTYRLYRSHGMITRKDCFVCHDERARSYAIPMADVDLCAKCHDPRPAGKFIHGPVAIGSCTVCHDPHGAVTRRRATLILRHAIPAGSCFLPRSAPSDRKHLRHLRSAAVLNRRPGWLLRNADQTLSRCSRRVAESEACRHAGAGQPGAADGPVSAGDPLRRSTRKFPRGRRAAR